MKAVPVIVASAVISLAVTQQILARDVPGNPVFWPTQRTRAEGALELRYIGTCVYGKQPSEVFALLHSVPGSKDESRIVREMQSRLQQCFRNSDASFIRFSTSGLRGAVAEGVYRAAFPTDPSSAPMPEDSATLPPLWLEAYRKDPTLGPALALHQLAACIVQAAPADAQKLVRSSPGDDAEAASMGAITAYLGPCVNQGQNFSSDRPTLRALIAEAVYDRFVGVGNKPAIVH